MADLAAARRDLGAFAEMVGRPMTKWQVGSLRLRKRISVIVAPRQSGKSRSLSLKAVHEAFRKPGVRVLVISAGDEAAKRLLAEVRRIVSDSELLRTSVVDEKASLVTLSNGSEIRSVPASERQIRGWTVDLLLVDEAALLPDDLLTGAAYPTTAARPEARIVLASSATSANGAFYDAATLGKQGSEHTETFVWKLTDCEWISPSTIAAARESMSEARFKAEYLGEFASGADCLFPRALLDRCTAPYDLPGVHGLRESAGLGGIDWGAVHDRTTLVSIGRLAEPAGVFAIQCAHAWPSGEPLDGEGGIIGQIADLGAAWEMLSAETNALGWPLSRALARRLSESPISSTVNYINTTADSKAAGYSALRMLMEKGQLVVPEAAPELLRELLLLRVEIAQSGSERIEASGSGHDDLADGCYLATAPYQDKDGRWRTRLGDAAEQHAPAVDVEIEGPTVTTGSGLVIPQNPAFDPVGGIVSGPPIVGISPSKHRMESQVHSFSPRRGRQRGRFPSINVRDGLTPEQRERNERINNR